MYEKLRNDFRLALLKMTKSKQQIEDMALGAANRGDDRLFHLCMEAGYQSYSSQSSLLLAARGGHEGILAMITGTYGNYAKDDIAQAAWEAERNNHTKAAEYLVSQMTRDVIFFNDLMTSSRDTSYAKEFFNAPEGIKKLLKEVRDVFEFEELLISPRLSDIIESGMLKTYKQISYLLERDRDLSDIQSHLYNSRFGYDLTPSPKAFRLEGDALEAKLRARMRPGDLSGPQPAAG